MKKLSFILLSLLLAFGSVDAQVGIGTNNPDASAILELFAADKGLLIPRMTTDQRESIKDNTTLANGLLIFDTDLNKFLYYNESQDLWISANNWVSEAGINDDVYYIENGNVGIGTDIPSEKLEVVGNVSVTGEFIGDGSIPLGGIIMWSGTVAPDGWALCNGLTVNGMQTPDLQGQFVVGYSPSATDYDEPGDLSIAGTTTSDVGGEEFHTLTEAELPNHTHAITDVPHNHTINIFVDVSDDDVDGFNYLDGANTGNNSADDRNNVQDNPVTGSSVDADLDITAAGTGGNQAHENRPPFYTLAYIMRIR